MTDTKIVHSDADMTKTGREVASSVRRALAEKSRAKEGPLAGIVCEVRRVWDEEKDERALEVLMHCDPESEEWEKAAKATIEAVVKEHGIALKSIEFEDADAADNSRDASPETGEGHV